MAAREWRPGLSSAGGGLKLAEIRFEYGGNVFISKHGTKAKGKELARLQWEGDRILWKIGTGETPYYRDDRRCSVSTLDGYLPVVTQRWENEGLNYTEEAFATLLSGPLSPDDAGRSEETPAILMMRLTAENPTGSERQAHLLAEPRSGRAALGRGESRRGGGRCSRKLRETAAASRREFDRRALARDARRGRALLVSGAAGRVQQSGAQTALRFRCGGPAERRNSRGSIMIRNAAG